MLWSFATILALHVGLYLAALASTRVTNPLYGDRAANLKRRIEQAGPDRPRVVVMLGTSRTANGFNAGRLEGLARAELHQPVVVQNFGILGTGPAMQFLYLRRLANDGIRPDLLLIEVLPAFYSDGNGGSPEKATFVAGRLRPDESKYLPRYGIPAETGEKGWQRLALNPWGELRFQLLVRVASTFVPWSVVWRANKGMDNWGWLPIKAAQVKPEDYRENFKMARQLYQDVLKTFVPSPQAVAALEDMLAFCRGQGITAVMVLYPEGSDFRGLYSPRTEACIQELFGSVARRHNVTLIDARTWIGDEEFADSHHLLRRSATQFTERLGVDHVIPRLRLQAVVDRR